MLADVLVKVAGFEKKPRGKYYPRPSMAGPEKCLRMMVYWAMGMQEKAPSDRLIMIFDDGTWHEELTADWIRRSAYQLHSEQMGVDIVELPFIDSVEMRPCPTCGSDDDGNPRVEVPSNMLHGHIDGIITDLMMNDFLYEHKAINHFTFQRYWSGEWPFDYLTQCFLYIHGLQKDLPGLDQAVLLIKNKNTAQYIEFILRYDRDADKGMVVEKNSSYGDRETGTPQEPLLVMERVVGGVVDRFEQIHQHVLNNSLPPRGYELGDWHCEYCGYSEMCWEGYEEEYDNLVSDAVLEGEIVDLARYYLEVSNHINEMKEERDALKRKIKAILEEAEVKKGKAGEYTIHWQLQKRSRINKDKIPPSVLASATEKSLVEMLTIRKPKKKEESK